MSSSKLTRGIGRWDLVALFINSIVGAGIFGLPGRVQALVGGYAVLVYLGCALLVLLIMLCFNEVASRFTQTGGPYLYAQEAFGPMVGFQVGWLTWLSRVFAFAALANLAADYLAHFGGVLGTRPGRAMVITGLVMVLAVANVRGVRTGVAIVNVFTIGKLIPLVLFVALGVAFVEPERLRPGAWPGIGASASALLLLIFAFTGFEKAFITAGETRDPQRTVPFAALTALGVVATLYILIHIVCAGTLPGLADSSRPLADAAGQFLGPAGGLFMVVGAAVSIIGTMNGNMLVAPRLLYAMAEHGQLPRPLEAVHPVRHTPHVAIWVTAAVMLVLSLSGSFITAVAFSTLARLFTYGLTCAAVPVLRRRDPDTVAPFRLPGGSAIPLAALLAIGWVLTTVAAVQWRDLAIAVGIGLIAAAVRR